MNYLQWNNAIGEYFFNFEKAESEIYLFITRFDIIKVGKEQGLEGSEDDVFLDYINGIRSGIPGKPIKGNILDHALYAYRKWKENPISIVGVPTNFPLYLGYLTIFVLPLTEQQQLDLRVDAYYPRINKFLTKHELPHFPYQNECYNWNILWNDLEEWSIIIKNTELGYFEIHPFKNDRWIYVGKPLSQSVFTIYAIKSLPKLYDAAGLVPGNEITGEEVKVILLRFGRQYLDLSYKVLNTIRDPDNELGQSIINIVKRNYHAWVGYTDQYDPEGQTIKKGNTIAQLRLCVEGDKMRGYKTYYRLYTKLDFPEDLSFIFNNKEYQCRQFGKGWSKPLFISFKKDLVLEDELNKWVAKFPDKIVRLLIEGKNYHLSGWVEVPYLVSSRMLLIVKEELMKSIEDWGECFLKDDFNKVWAPGIPDGYILYEIRNPPIGHPDIMALQFNPDKRLIISGGIKVGVRTWLNGILPEIELENGLGNERLNIIYEGESDKIPLERKDTDQPVWILPNNIRTDIGFYIKVEGYDTYGDQLKNLIIATKNIITRLSDDKLPARDKFGQIIERRGDTSYVFGSRLHVVDERRFTLRQSIYSHDFRPEISKGEFEGQNHQKVDSLSEALLTFLTIKVDSTAKDYFEAFESVYLKKYSPEEIENHPIELSKLKRWSLNFLDYMGYLDYEYSNKTIAIVVNPPRFILIPTKNGRKSLLIGGRTPELIEKVKAEALKQGLHFELESQNTSLSPFLLPQTITLIGYDDKSGINIENRIGRVAEACSIGYDPNKFTQFRLAEFSGTINEYENILVQDETFKDQGWPTRAFDYEQLQFRPVPVDSYDTTFSLIEYRLNEYTFTHRFWKDNVPYNVNKNWGRYLIMKKNNIQVIYNDRQRRLIAIPASLPLPRLLSEAFVLYSGKAPIRVELKFEKVKTWYNIYFNLPHIIAYNSCLNVGQKLIESNIDI